MKLGKILILLIAFSHISAQENDIIFEHFDTKNGLTQNSVTAIAQDELGYIWFSTQNGLNKFDGYNFTAYLFDPDNKNSIQGNWINHLIADKHGKIWIFFGFGGIDCFDTKTEEFEQYIYDEKKTSSLPEKYLRYAYLDKWDNLWLGTFQNGILKFARDKNTFIKYSNDLLNKSSLSSNRTRCAFADTLNGNKNLWVGTANAEINKINIETGEIERIQWRDFKPSKKTYDFINSKNNEKKKIASIIKIGDVKKINSEFFLKEKSKLLIVCQGEAMFENNFDFGKILKENKTVWESNAFLSAHAGGEIRNRIQFDIIELEQGKYNLDFQTDSLHSFDKWYNNAPDFLELWGIQVYKLDLSDIPPLQSNIKDIQKRTSMNSQNITAFERINNDLWIGTWGGGLNKMNLITGEFSNYKTLNRGDNYSKNYSREFLKDSKNRIWMIDKDYYLSCFDAESKKFINISTADYNFDNILITKIIKDTEGTIWAGTRKEGLFQIAFASNNLPVIKHFGHNKLNAGSISHNTINYLFQDISENMWVATHGGGINKFNTKKQKFKLINDEVHSTPRLSSGRVTSFAEDNSGNIWISTADAGLNKFNIIENRIEKINLPEEIFKNISTLYFDGNENLYIGNYLTGIYKYNINKKKYIKVNGGKQLDIIYGNSVSCITKDKEENLWVGLHNRGAIRINEKTGDIKNFTQLINDSTSLPSVSVWNIYVDKNSDVWIATASGGMSKLIKGTSKFKTYSNKGENPYRFPNNTATYFFEDSKGNLWIGSFSAGISLMDRKTEKFEYYTINDGLPGNRIDGILEDEKGNLWISTNNGISKFDPIKKTFRNYDYMDGLQDNEFTRNASLKTKNGLMFFGGDHGLNYFYPNEIKDNFYIPKINITAFKKSDEEIKFDKSLEAIEQIELSYNEVQISFEFVALDYTSPEKNKYAYKMEGFDKDWVYSGKRRYANYTNLFPGEYVFK